MNTLGEVITVALIAAALIVVPYKLAKAWVWPYLRPLLVMLRLLDWNGSMDADDMGDRHLSPAPSHPIAKPSTAVNDQVTVTSGDVPVAAREIIYHEARAQAIADLLRDGLITNQAKAIESVYHCTRTAASRSESPYQKAKHRIDELTNVRPVYYDDLRKRVEEEVSREIREEEAINA